MTPEERTMLRTISEKNTLAYESPCPLSYNVSKDQKPDDNLWESTLF